MEQNKQKKNLALTEEQRAAILKSRAIHEQRMKTDPEYRETWEKRHRKMEKHSIPFNDTQE
ncbi:MAG: hypothetical protein ACI3X1_07330 [Eubacteriales bacterium]